MTFVRATDVVPPYILDDLLLSSLLQSDLAGNGSYGKSCDRHVIIMCV
jgi:hypothetical protein